jgi:hypothetical protein
MLSQQTANIPAWCIADTSPNEWTILQRAIGFGKLDTNETSTTTDEEAPATRYDQYPLAMAASGRVVLKGRRWSRINKGHAFKVLLVLVAAAAFAIIVLQRDLGTSNQLQDCREIPGVKGSQDAPNVKSRRIGTGLANVISQPPTQKLSALALSPAEMAFERTVLAFVHQKTATLERRVQMVAEAFDSRSYPGSANFGSCSLSTCAQECYKDGATHRGYRSSRVVVQNWTTREAVDSRSCEGQ